MSNQRDPVQHRSPDPRRRPQSAGQPQGVSPGELRQTQGGRDIGIADADKFCIFNRRLSASICAINLSDRMAKSSSRTPKSNQRASACHEAPGRETWVQAASLFTLCIPALARSGKTSGPSFSIPFEFARDRGSLLISARINNRPVSLIVDTGSSHTIVRPSVAAVNPPDLAPPRVGGGIIGGAIGREVTLEVGRQVWQRRRVAVMDLSPVLSVYQESIDGVLGIDCLLEFSQSVINLKDRTVTFVS